MNKGNEELKGSTIILLYNMKGNNEYMSRTIMSNAHNDDVHT